MYALRRRSATCLCASAFLCTLAADPCVAAPPRREAPGALRAAAPPVLEGVQVEIAGVVQPFAPVGLRGGGVDFELLESSRGGTQKWKDFTPGPAQLQPLEISYRPDPGLRGIGAWAGAAATRGPADARRDVSVRFVDRAGQAALVLHYAGAVPTELVTADPSRITLVLAVDRVEAEPGAAPLLQPLQPRPEASGEPHSDWAPDARLAVVVEGLGEFTPRMVAGGEVTAAQARAPGEVGSLRIYGGGLPIPVAGPIVTRALIGPGDRWNVIVNVLDRGGAVVSTTAFMDCLPVRYQPPAGDPASGGLLEEVLELKPTRIETGPVAAAQPSGATPDGSDQAADTREPGATPDAGGPAADAQSAGVMPSGLPGVQVEVAGLAVPFSPVGLAGGGATADVLEVTDGSALEWREFAVGDIQVQALEITYPTTPELQGLASWHEAGQSGSDVRRDVHVRLLDRDGQVVSGLGYRDAFPAQLQAGPEATTLVLQTSSFEAQSAAGAPVQPLEPRPESAAEAATAWVGPRLAVEVEGLGQLSPRMVAGGEVILSGDGGAATGTGATSGSAPGLKEVGTLRIYGGADPISVAGPIARSVFRGESTRWTVHVRDLDRSGNPVGTTSFSDCILVRYLPPVSDAASGALLEEVLELKPRARTDDGPAAEAQPSGEPPAGLPGVQVEVGGLAGPFSPVRLAGGGATAEVVEVTQGDDGEWRQFAPGNTQFQPLEITYQTTADLQGLGAWYDAGQTGADVRRDVHVRHLGRAGQVASALGYRDAFPAQLQAGPGATTLALQVAYIELELGGGALLQPLEPRPESGAEAATAWVGPRLAVEVEGLGSFAPRLVAGGEVSAADGPAATATGATAEQGVALKEVGALRVYGGADPIAVARPIADSALRGESTRWTVHVRELNASGNPVRITTFHDCLFVRYLPPASDPASGALLEEVLELKPERVEVQ